jgi:hypothetical protein
MQPGGQGGMMGQMGQQFGQIPPGQGAFHAGNLGMPNNPANNNMMGGNQGNPYQ